MIFSFAWDVSDIRCDGPDDFKKLENEILRWLTETPFIKRILLFLQKQQQDQTNVIFTTARLKHEAKEVMEKRLR